MAARDVLMLVAFHGRMTRLCHRKDIQGARPQARPRWTITAPFNPRSPASGPAPGHKGEFDLAYFQYALHSLNHLIDIGDAEPCLVGPG
jgi:hypothetical protein